MLRANDSGGDWHWLLLCHACLAESLVSEVAMMQKRLLFILIFVLLLACGQEAVVPTPQAIPETTATRVPTAVPRTPETVDNDIIAPLQKSITAVRDITSIHIATRREEMLSGEVRNFENHINLEGEGQMQAWEQLPNGIQTEILCTGQRIRRCYAQVEDHPWVRYSFFETSTGTYADLYREQMSGRTVLYSERQDNEIVVEWEGDTFRYGAFAPELKASGAVWLQADSYLPVREVLTYHDPVNGRLIRRDEFTYSQINRPVEIVPTPAPVALPAVETATLPERRFDVTLEETEWPGELYVPEGIGPFSAVLVLHGSEGGVGFSGTVAKQIAEAGYVTLAYCYFGCPDTPAELKDIELTSLLDALFDLRSRPDVQADSVAVVGFSRGAELSLILGSFDPEIPAIAAIMGSSDIWPALSQENGVAWRYQGEPLSFMNTPVTKIDAPVLFMHGALDRLWPATYSYQLASSRELFALPYELIIFPTRGHDIGNRRDVDHIISFLQRTLP